MYTVFIHDHEFLELSSYNYKIILRLQIANLKSAALQYRIN